MTDPRAEMQHQMERMGRVISLSFGAESSHAAAKMSACPQQMYADLLESEPVRDLGEGCMSLTKMNDILFVTRHPAVTQGSKYLGSDRPAIPLGLDGEIHRQYRRLIDPIFTPRKVAPLADQVRALANGMIDGFIDEGSTDAYATWCEPLPSTIFLSIMGLPMEDLADFLKFKNLTLAGSSDPTINDQEQFEKRMEGVVWLQGYFNANLDEREREDKPRDDIIGALLVSEVDGNRLTRQDVLDIIGLFMVAGLDTVAASLSCMLSFFARNPEQRQLILDDRSKLRGAIEELLRFESPVSEGFRVAQEELTLPSGPTVPAGTWMHISWAAANLDPDVFPDPVTPILDRNPNPHIGFASGYHRCLGSHLARMELATALDVWHDRIPNYALATDEPLAYSGNPRSPIILPLAW